MRNRRPLLISTSIVSLALAASGCSASSSGSGSGSQSVASAVSSIGASPDASGTASAGSAITLPAGGSTGGNGNATGSSGGGGSKTTAPSSKHTTAKPTPTPEPTIMPALVSVTYNTPGCTSMSGTSTVVITWTSKAATSAYLAESVIAQPFDPKDSGGVGPLSANGSKTMTYNCANGDDYFMVGVYNSIGKQYESVQVPNPKAPN